MSPAYLHLVRRIIISITLLFFSFSTLVMPYGNFDDVKSLCAVYNHCLKQDADMDFFEFIGEKLLIAGFDPDEENEPQQSHHQQPIHGANTVQIQTGALYQHINPDIIFATNQVAIVIPPLKNSGNSPTGFTSGVFHPPAQA
jgi:hypothetical protein